MAVCAPVEKVPLLLPAFFFLLSLLLSVSYPTIIDIHSFIHIHVPKPFNYHTLIP